MPTAEAIYGKSLIHRFNRIQLIGLLLRNRKRFLVKVTKKIEGGKITIERRASRTSLITD